VVEYKAVGPGATPMWAIETKTGAEEYRLLSLYCARETAHAVVDKLNVIEAEENVKHRRC